MSVLSIPKKHRNEVDIKRYEEAVEDEIMSIYPGYLWAAVYNKHLNVFNIYNTYVSCEYGVVTNNLDKYATISEFKDHLKMMCGELLERANLPRSAKTLDIDMLIAEVERSLGHGRTLKGMDTSK